jgi:hypothetical protein
MRVAERLRPLARYEPWIVLAPLVVAQWIAVGIFGITVQRNGWLFYQGGDQTWFYTSAWVLAHGHVPETLVGYAWALAQLPLAAIAGPNFLDGVAPLVVLQFALLLPLGLIAMYLSAARIGGRAIGFWAGALWITLPYLSVAFFVERYHERYVEQVLPQVLGLTGLGDFPSMVALAWSGYFVIRALDTRLLSDVVVAGLIAGLAIGIKPANGLFVFAPIVALVATRQWKGVAAFGAATVPALITLTLWKYRGSGIAILANEPLRLAAGVVGDQFAPPSLLERVKQYVPLDREQLNSQFLGFREYFWSARVFEFIAVAGTLAVVRRSWPKALFLTVWLAAFFVVKGSSPAVSVESGSFWRLLLPAFPAYFLLMASIPLLVPIAGMRLAERFPLRTRRYSWRHPAVIALAALGAVVPLLIVAALPSQKEPVAGQVPLRSLFLPIDSTWRPTVEPVEGGLQLRWSPRPGGHADVFYVLYRSPTRYRFESNNQLVDQGLMCQPTSGATKCSIEMDEVARGRDRVVVNNPGRGAWTYRIGVAANWLDDASQGDVFLVSSPLNVRVG